jgi:hypothetical protein
LPLLRGLKLVLLILAYVSANCEWIVQDRLDVNLSITVN